MILFLCFFVFILILFTKYSFLKKPSRNDHKSISDIPAPGCFPIIGNIGDLFSGDEKIWKNRVEKARKFYPIYRLEQFNVNTVFLLHPDDIQIILENTKLSIKGPVYDTLRKWTGNGLIVSEGSFWQKRRKILTKSFHFAILRENMKIFNKHVDFLTETFKNQVNQPIEVISAIKYMTLKIINDIILDGKSNVSKNDFENYGGAIKIMTKIISYKSTNPYHIYYYNFLSLKKKEDEALRTILEFSKKFVKNNDLMSTTDDKSRNTKRLLDVMLEKPDIFDYEGVLDEINTFTFGGHDTTSTALKFILLVLANHPEYQDTLYQDIIENSEKDRPATHAEISNMMFLDRFLKECFRLFPPVTFIGRLLVENCVTKSGYELPAGTLIVIDMFNLHRNPRVFPNPEKFDPDRFSLENISKRHPFAYIPFSAGPRNCIAQKFALLELKTTICAILKKFIVEPGDLIENIQLIPDTILDTKEEIRVKFSLRA